MVRSALFWDITQRIVVISYRRLGTTDRCFVQGLSIFFTLEDGTDRLYPDVGKENYHYAESPDLLCLAARASRFLGGA